jgi:O-antigen ligase
METIKKIASYNLAKIGLMAMFALLLLPSNIKAIAILFFGLTIVTFLFKRKFYFDYKYFLLNGALYLSLVLTLVYSDNTDIALRKLEHASALIVFPFIFALTTQEERKALLSNLSQYLWVFIIAVFLFNCIAFIWFFATRFSFESMLTHFHTVLRLESGKYSIHPIYLSMHCGMAILFSLELLRKNSNRIQIAALLTMDIVIVAFLLLYAKKGPLIALIAVLTLFMLFQQSKKFIKPYLIAIIALSCLIIAIPKTRNKFVELLKIESIDTGVVTSTNIRYSIYKTAQELVVESPLVGYGIGDSSDTLINKYKEKGEDLLAQRKYNAHSQYLSILLIGGFISLMFFMLTIGVNVLYAIRFDNQLLILTLVFYGIVMFTENILEREQGVIFFSLFLNFFTLKSLFVRE